MSDDSRDPARLAESATAAVRDDLSGLPGAARLADEAVDPAEAPAAAAGPAATGPAQRVVAEPDEPLDELRRLEREARSYIRRNPLRSAALAFAAGYLIALLRRL